MFARREKWWWWEAHGGRGYDFCGKSAQSQKGRKIASYRRVTSLRRARHASFDRDGRHRHVTGCYFHNSKSTSAIKADMVGTNSSRDNRITLVAVASFAAGVVVASVVFRRREKKRRKVSRLNGEQTYMQTLFN